MEFKKPDLNAARYTSKKITLLNASFLNEFRKKFPEYKDVSNAVLKNIVKTFNKNIWKNAVESRDGSELPEGLGYIFVGTCQPPKVFNTDFGESIKKKSSFRYRHRNYESDNYLAKIFYTNFANKYKFAGREIWRFKGVREFTRTVSVEYPKNWKKYLEVDNFQHISELYKKSLRRDYTRTPNPISEDYNEFLMD